MRLGDDFGKPYAYVQQCHDENFVGVYYFIEKDLSGYEDDKFEKEFLKECSKNMPENNERNREKSLNSKFKLFRLFCKEIKIGDIILCPENNTYSSFLVGKIISDCYFNEEEGLKHRRDVEWFQNKLNLKIFSKKIKNEEEKRIENKIKLNAAIVKFNDDDKILNDEIKEFFDKTKHKKKEIELTNNSHKKDNSNKTQQPKPLAILIKRKTPVELAKLKQKLTPSKKREFLNKALDIMQQYLPKFVVTNLKKNNKNSWWQELVLGKLPTTITFDLPKHCTLNKCKDILDTSLCLKIIIENWHNIFKQFERIKLSWVHELIEIRNDVSHWTNKKAKGKYPFDIIKHSLDTMKLVMGSINSETANKISTLITELEENYED